MSKRFQRVHTYSNWVEYDTYGKPEQDPKAPVGVLNVIKHGDKVELKWPDGTVEKQKVTVEKDSYEISDMGIPWTVTTTKAYVTTKVNGAKVKLRLKDTNVLVRKVEK